MKISFSIQAWEEYLSLQRQDKKEQAKNKYSSNQSDESENTQAEQSLLELVIPRYI